MKDPFLAEYEQLRAKILQWFREHASADGSVPDPLDAAEQVARDIGRDPRAVELVLLPIVAERDVFYSYPRNTPWLPEADTRAATRAAFQISEIRRRLRREIAEGRHRCAECSATEELQIDHIVPISKGGTNDADNLQILCRTCNVRKGTRLAAAGA